MVWHLPRGQAGPHVQPENRGARDILPGASLNVTEARLSTLLLLPSTALNKGIARVRLLTRAALPSRGRVTISADTFGFHDLGGNCWQLVLPYNTLGSLLLSENFPPKCQ